MNIIIPIISIIIHIKSCIAYPFFHNADCPRRQFGVVEVDSFNGIYAGHNRPNDNPLKCPVPNYIGNGQVDEVGVECVNRGNGNPVAWTTGHEDGYWDGTKQGAARYTCPPSDDRPDVTVESIHPIRAQYRCKYMRRCQPVARPVKKKSTIKNLLHSLGSRGNKHGHGPHRVADQEVAGARAEHHNAYDDEKEERNQNGHHGHNYKDHEEHGSMEVVTNKYYNEYGEHGQDQPDNVYLFALGVILTIGICCFVAMISIMINFCACAVNKYYRFRGNPHSKDGRDRYNIIEHDVNEDQV